MQDRAAVAEGKVRNSGGRMRRTCEEGVKSPPRHFTVGRQHQIDG
ncbi:hypothetical protein SCATT_00970 [Streptantibioticus cattleyicolor NRRL 8057 = DSM 46488]|uniref:Uncharacterized protein n=1 Tax=Streptantibioticus cattleyicolor (strain ATCC 35852 / DSM 46488 / JCM 4925 / NBRC 14057 / NRRL 8057) TaxID=1003195 RepID=G8WYS7_STREN|nr:hypothetical protein SCATT_00970 [Streptantibioticus cattleyicolor NRRL 8057 = DSM 46488]